MRAAVRLLLAVLVVSCLSWGLLASPVLAGTRTPVRPAGIVAGGADLVNARTAAVLWSRGLRSKRPIASLTKVMTAIVVTRAGHLDRRITVTQRAETYAQERGAASAGLRPGDVLTAWQLLEGMLLPSGADAA